MPAIPRPHENEGVGEHVRTSFHVGPKATCEIAEPLTENRTNEENLFLLPDRPLASEPAKENDPTVDLMSRRHPLSSTRTFEKALMTCRLSRSRQLQKAKLLLLGDLAGLLRSLLHCALRLLRLLCLLSFLGHVALRCVRWLNRCMQSGIECTLIPNTPTQRKKQRLA
jgi:hypothetical protein